MTSTGEVAGGRGDEEVDDRPFFTALPLSFVVAEGEFRWVFWPDHAPLAAGSLVLGVAAWIAHAIVARRLRPKGF